MRCTNNRTDNRQDIRKRAAKRHTALFLAAILAGSLTGCGKEPDPNAYRIYESSYHYNVTAAAPLEETPLFAERFCVPPKNDVGTKKIDTSLALAGGVFNNTTKKTVYAQSIFEKMYPASTTKILTAYLAVKYGKLNEVYTVSENACRQSYDSSVAGLSPGDQIALKDLLYGLMLASGNDAAVAIAEGIDGDEETFVKRMNEEAKKLGATGSHFVTSNGLHDEEHYTTVYDMYLIFSAALADKDFRKVLETVEYTAHYSDASGMPKETVWTTTNGYLTTDYTAPDGITVIGGKTGTTGSAGYCLVMLSENEKKDQIVSIVFHADYRSTLYQMMSQIVAKAR